MFGHWFKVKNKGTILFAGIFIAITAVLHLVLLTVHPGYRKNNACTFLDKQLCQKVPFCEPVYTETNPCKTGEREICPTVSYPPIFQKCALKHKVDNVEPTPSETTKPTNTDIVPNNVCTALWSNCDCNYRPIKKEDLDPDRPDCARECFGAKNERPEKPNSLFANDQCILIYLDKDRFDCASYINDVNCPIKAGCKLEPGNTDVYPARHVCKGDINSTNVIVGLNIVFEAEGYLSPEEIQNQRDLVKSTQDALISQIPGIYEVYKQYTITPNLSLKVNDEALEFLQSSHLVKVVQEDNPVPPLGE